VAVGFGDWDQRGGENRQGRCGKDRGHIACESLKALNRFQHQRGTMASQGGQGGRWVISTSWLIGEAGELLSLVAVARLGFVAVHSVSRPNTVGPS
jgi:hypothetical protein